VRTLVVSDFHLGVGPRHAVLELPRPRERLLAALRGIDRLVLLGDAVELLERSAAHSVPVAEPVFAALGDRMGAQGEIVYVPGNHDRALIAKWLRGRADPLAVDAAVPADASPGLSRLVAALAPARVRVHYPGVWLEEGLWALHGHYLDRHLLPDSSYGVARGLLGRLPRDGALPDDYEQAGGPSLSRLQARLPALLRWPLEELLELARAATMPAPHRVLSPRFARASSSVLGFQMRRASVPALARVVHRLGVDARTVVFGHVHRLGPLPGDAPADWTGPTGAMRLLNCGSWVYEPLLVNRARPPHPYWPGGAILLESGKAPRALGLLDELSAAELHHAGPRRRGRR
jgi:UDP-2,3-diacylglucosamine pyrophosphatase LpxH